MRQLKYNLSLFDWKWDWNVVYRKDHDNILSLVRTLEKERPPVSVDWDPKEVMEFDLIPRNGLVDDYPRRARGNRTMVPIADETGAEWRHVLEWSGAGGMERATAGPPKVNARFHRIVSPEMKAILESFHLPPHEFIPANVRHYSSGEQRPYFLFHLIADFRTELECAYWPAMAFHIENRNLGTLMKAYGPGSAENLEAAYAQHRNWVNENVFQLIPFMIKIPYMVYCEPYDLIWTEGWMTLSDELAEAIRTQLGEEYIGPWSGKPTFTGFLPGTDVLPEGI